MYFLNEDLNRLKEFPYFIADLYNWQQDSGFPPLADSDDSINEARERALHESGLWPDTVMGFGLVPGIHQLVELTQNVRANPLYAALL